MLARPARTSRSSTTPAPELLVGESMVPAVVPILRRLGLEEETASFSRVKPGVSFIWSPTDPDSRVVVTFQRFAPSVFPYAYNIPRPHFDDVLLKRAIESGVRHVAMRAQLLPGAAETGAELVLAPETLAAVPEPGWAPHLIVDATGRARHAARVLSIPARLGPRKDVAHFAHFEGFRWDDAPGRCSSRADKRGMERCIPLQERLSIGIVLNQDDAARLGRAPENGSTGPYDRCVAVVRGGERAARDERRPIPTIS
jgi:hypothetical protein